MSIDLVKPGEVWGDRVNELNLRFAKVLRFSRTRTHVGIDVFNVLNSDAILTYNQTFRSTVRGSRRSRCSRRGSSRSARRSISEARSSVGLVGAAFSLLNLCTC